MVGSVTNAVNHRIEITASSTRCVEARRSLRRRADAAPWIFTTPVVKMTCCPACRRGRLSNRRRARDRSYVYLAGASSKAYR